MRGPVIAERLSLLELVLSLDTLAFILGAEMLYHDWHNWQDLLESLWRPKMWPRLSSPDANWNQD